ncbi:hypothetical protein [uncultured Novosphingobium sp.]|uniref:hypothetical protein n=1 Tax=uncultured Novosphingobium sp. TaxID=292277 RepID=UPI00258FB2C6|nr:hypothetical protein [uncultured Novosphingobium sp.]
MTFASSFDPLSSEALANLGTHYPALARSSPFHPLETDCHPFRITSEYAEIKETPRAE